MMLSTAKVFANGNSQAIRLPKIFRVDVQEMWISKNELTGEILLKPKNEETRINKLNALFDMIAKEPLTEDLLPPRDLAWAPNPLASWSDAD